MHLYRKLETRTHTPYTQTPAFVEMLISQGSILVGFLARTFRLSTRLSERLHRNLLIPLATALLQHLHTLGVLLDPERNATIRASARLDFSSARYGLVLRPVLAVAVLVRTQADLSNSMLGEVSRLIHLPSEHLTNLDDVSRHFGSGSSCSVYFETCERHPLRGDEWMGIWGRFSGYPMAVWSSIHMRTTIIVTRTKLQI
ncbi:hypothetical protein BDP55DRAFT_18258 [Colletotrichum godetiae]|uniref:Uncharacterized protein n=1 Tax=Colletotrichum godetiae TaxID=1209918 RepID=A0AAJ0F5E1_9PEZI|nr:uncharacterized protein BDP55DRAFT_18258 [Colletotrichum godetiae]KAK1701358.1 hypothetical protein BDP55DRAFT_18258 [Colletotrichum godetiae]